MKQAILALAALLAALSGSAAGPEPQADDFRWRATLDTGGRQGLLRAELPGEALERLQARDAADVRVFDARGEPVAFALRRPPAPAAAARAPTARVPALPLFEAAAGSPPAGTVQVRVDGASSSVWVDLRPGDRPAPTATQRLPSALFDTRALRHTVSGLQLHGTWPANVPLRFSLATSPDLERWTPVAVEGRIYRFDGAGAPANDTLELRVPLALQGLYLRLDWAGQDGVQLDGVNGWIVAPAPVRNSPSAALPTGRADGTTALEWQLPFATRITRLALATDRADTVVPVRILGRDQPSAPWRTLGQAVVYRVGPAEAVSTNPPAPLEVPAAVRWLRVEATHGARLPGLLQARAVFEPLEVVFVAGAAAPYRLAAGHAEAPRAGLPLDVLAVTGPTDLAALPLARIAGVQVTPAAPVPAWARWLPAGVDGRTAGLWLVLVLGVLVLGGAAWSLLRQGDRKA